MSDAVPHAPASILGLLARLGIAASEVIQQPGHTAPQAVQALLLEDSAGTVLVLLARNQLLDLMRLKELTGRSLKALGAEYRQRMLDKHQMGCMPALPPITSGPCWYEQSLLQQPSLLLESGQPGVLLQVSCTDFKRLLGQARGAYLALALSDIPLNLSDPDQDFAQIRSAMRKALGFAGEQRLDITLQVPPLAACAQKLIKLRLDPDATVDDISSVVESDAELTQLLLRCTASPSFAVAGKARTVEDAMVRVLGFDLGVHLALGLAVDRTLRQASTHPQTAACLQRMLLTATVMRVLTRAMPLAHRPETGLSSLCGLLHNIGYLLLEHAFAQHVPLISQHLAVNPHVHRVYLEQYLLGISREQLGGWLMRNWDLPAELATALRFQNYPGYSGPYAQYANLLCLTLQLIDPRRAEKGPNSALEQSLFARLGIDQQQAEQTIAALSTEAATTSADLHGRVPLHC